ncbi:virion structural protein [Pseudomonas phage PhiPA3]|uniref:Virion structural protein n=1 Tax=Pseudomonas phage PhiPA3 TaxID=998086 RepID=F8SJW0_BPPA3|nr:virion structural protein [Pseudomonas phage PhiPA3]AEH03505.1 virion structural protein [Pseudomonas phage PhiPA3]
MMESILGTIASPGDNLVPGPQAVVAGDTTYGYYGEFSGGLPQPQALCDLVNATEGGLLVTSTTWLKFCDGGKIYFMTKVPIRNNMRWSELDAKGLVTGKQITIGKHTYICRIMTGIADKAAGTAGGEWNRWMYPLCTTRPSGPVWANFTVTQLGVTSTTNGGGANWVQEEQTSAPAYHYYRGFTGIAVVGKEVSNSNIGNYGWRPILELVN